MTTPFYIQKEQGRIRAAALRAHLDSLNDGSYKVTVKRATSKTTRQNSYLHVLFDIAAKAMNEECMGDGTPWTLESVKQYAKDEHLYPLVDMILPGGEVRQMAKNTRDLDDLEAGQTIERVIAHFAVEHRIVLPPPNTQEELKLEAA